MVLETNLSHSDGEVAHLSLQDLYLRSARPIVTVIARK